MNKETKSTPGPWRAAIGDNYRPLSEEDKRPIAVVEHDMFDAIDIFGPNKGIHGASYEELNANAKLIASAPALLEALKEIMTVYEKDGHLLNFNVNIARNAIQQTEGK